MQAVCQALGDRLLQWAVASRHMGPRWVGRSEPQPLRPGSTRWLWELRLHVSGNFLSENEGGLGFGVLYYYFYLNVFILASWWGERWWFVGSLFGLVSPRF